MVRPMPTFSILAGASGAIDSLTRGLAVDLAPVRVNAVSVGLVRTEVSLLNILKARRKLIIRDAF